MQAAPPFFGAANPIRLPVEPRLNIAEDPEQDAPRNAQEDDRINPNNPRNRIQKEPSLISVFIKVTLWLFAAITAVSVIIYYNSNNFADFIAESNRLKNPFEDQYLINLLTMGLLNAGNLIFCSFHHIFHLFIDNIPAPIAMKEFMLNRNSLGDTLYILEGYFYSFVSAIFTAKAETYLFFLKLPFKIVSSFYNLLASQDFLFEPKYHDFTFFFFDCLNPNILSFIFIILMLSSSLFLYMKPLLPILMASQVFSVSVLLISFTSFIPDIKIILMALISIFQLITICYLFGRVTTKYEIKYGPWTFFTFLYSLVYCLYSNSLPALYQVVDEALVFPFFFYLFVLVLIFQVVSLLFIKILDKCARNKLVVTTNLESSLITCLRASTLFFGLFKIPGNCIEIIICHFAGVFKSYDSVDSFYISIFDSLVFYVMKITKIPFSFILLVIKLIIKFFLGTLLEIFAFAFNIFRKNKKIGGYNSVGEYIENHFVYKFISNTDDFDISLFIPKNAIIRSLIWIPLYSLISPNIYFNILLWVSIYSTCLPKPQYV